MGQRYEKILKPGKKNLKTNIFNCGYLDTLWKNKIFFLLTVDILYFCIKSGIDKFRKKS